MIEYNSRTKTVIHETYSGGTCSLGEYQFCEEWVAERLFQRLCDYKDKHPKFKHLEFMLDVAKWKPKMQRWSPYMTDEDISQINKQKRRKAKLSRMAELEHL